MLHRAAGIAGGLRELARCLRVPSKQLTSWMEGEVPTPRTVFLRAWDSLSRGPTPTADGIG
jgi:hypothetical protein